MLTITLGPSKERITTADGKKMVVLQATVLQAKRRVPLNYIKKFENVDEVEIVGKARLRRIRFKLDPGTKKGIIEFLEKYHARTDMDFDCYAFANLMHNQPVHHCAYLLRFWDIESATELSVGGVVFFLDTENDSFHHAAIYLGHNVFVSVYGAGGDLEFSTLDDMQRDFGPSTAAMALPRKTES